MSLRARLLAGMVALVAVGLAIAAVATYAEQRSFLLHRVDQQVQTARFPIAAQIALRAPGALRLFPRGVPPRGLPPRAGGRRGRRPAGPAQFLPPGTFGVLLGAGAHPIAGPVSFSFDAGRVNAPPLPRRFPVTRPGSSLRLFSFGPGAGYRAVALAERRGTLLVAVPLRDARQTLDRLVVVEALVGGGVILTLLVLGWFVIRVGLRPLQRIGRTATEIAGGDYSRRVSPADGRTEVGRLGLSLNEMLGQIERAFAARTDSEERLRRFLADASHELRTPLTAVRGYAELYRLGAAREPEAVERAMARIEVEAARMGRLVEDLLTLARLDELPDAEPRRVNLAELAAHAVEDARTTAPGQIAFASQGAGWVLADPDGLRQVLANLLRNAVIHTPPGTLIEVAVADRGDHVELTVRDHGPGLPSGAGERVFERFWRAEGGRSRGPGGAGLGLAIVAAIVRAHHGQVEASDAPGGGALFRVLLPAAPSANAQGSPKALIQTSVTVRS